jgi:hypothetical protein
MVYLAEKSLKDAGDKVPADVKGPIEEKIEALKKVKESDDIEEVKSATANLSTEIQKIGQMLYNQGQGGAPNADAPGASDDAHEPPPTPEAESR